MVGFRMAVFMLSGSKWNKSVCEYGIRVKWMGEKYKSMMREGGVW